MFVETSYNLQRFSKTFPLPFLLHSVGVSQPECHIHRPHGHDAHHLLWVTRGEGLFHFGEHVITLTAGQGAFFRRELPHSYHAIGANFDTAWLTFTGSEGLLSFYGVKDYFCFDTPSSLTAAFATLITQCQGNSSPLSRSAAGYSLLITFLHMQFAASSSLEDQVDAYLENHFDQTLSLDEVAAAVNLSKYTLCHRYANTRGITVMEQLRRIRVAKAKRYLITTSHTIGDIGRLCGFDSPSYFSKIFREETGLSPAAFRTGRK